MAAAVFTGSLSVLLSRIIITAGLGMVHLLPKHCGCTTQRQLKALLCPVSCFLYQSGGVVDEPQDSGLARHK
jgi:hypothetical protein